MMLRRKPTRNAASLILAGALLGLAGVAAPAQQAVTIQTSIKSHRFEPANLSAPAGKPIVLRIRNLDGSAAEFESVSLRVEKVIAANSEAIINIRPLQPGRYNFFDDFNPQAKGVLVVQ